MSPCYFVVLWQSPEGEDLGVNMGFGVISLGQGLIILLCGFLVSSTGEAPRVCYSRGQCAKNTCGLDF